MACDRPIVSDKHTPEEQMSSCTEISVFSDLLLGSFSLSFRFRQVIPRCTFGSEIMDPRLISSSS